MTQEQVDEYKAADDHSKPKATRVIRQRYKTVNYASQYGVGAKTLARNAGCTVEEAKALLDAYWGKNWAILEVSKRLTVRTIGEEMWQLNPVNGFWYSLRTDKDRFSTLVQGTATYYFDQWIKNFRARRNQLTGQFHDEVILEVKAGHQDAATKLLKGALNRVNETFKLQVPLDTDVQFGLTYWDIH